MLSTLGWMVTVWWQGPELVSSSTYTGGLGYVPSYSPHLRRSLPNMIAPHSNEPPKIYPYHLLLITNYRLPADVDRCNLEVNTSPLSLVQYYPQERLAILKQCPTLPHYLLLTDIFVQLRYYTLIKYTGC